MTKYTVTAKGNQVIVIPLERDGEQHTQCEHAVSFNSVCQKCDDVQVKIVCKRGPATLELIAKLIDFEHLARRYRADGFSVLGEVLDTLAEPPAGGRQ